MKLIERIGDTKREIKLNASNAYIADAQKSLISNWQQDLVALSISIQNGDVAALTKSGELLKKIHMASLILGKGGNLDAIKDRDYSSLQSILQRQLFDGKGTDGKKYGLRNLFKEVAGGSVSDAQLKNRLTLYSKSGKATQSLAEINLKQDTGYKSKKRILGDVIHCEECIRYASIGWVGIDSDALPPIAVACSCRNNCRCTFQYSKTKKH